MIRLFTPVFILQAFCLYQAFKRKDDQKWFWIIIILPVIGSLIYLYHTFYSRRNVENLTEEVKSNLINNYKIDKLERELNFSDTVANKMELADEYLLKGNYDKSKLILESCLEGIYKDDPKLLIKLVKVNYLTEDFDRVIEYGSQVVDGKQFNSSEEKMALAWSYYKKGHDQLAQKLFEQMDIRFSNYYQRLEFAKYLHEIEKPELAKEKLEDLLVEIDSMDNYERKLKKNIYRLIRNYYNQLLKIT